MKWSNVLFKLQQMSPEDLDKEALVFNPFYGRVWPIEASANLADIAPSSGLRNTALVMAREPLNVA